MIAEFDFVAGEDIILGVDVEDQLIHRSGCLFVFEAELHTDECGVEFGGCSLADFGEPFEIGYRGWEAGLEEELLCLTGFF